METENKCIENKSYGISKKSTVKEFEILYSQSWNQ